MTAKEYLSQYRELNAEINDKLKKEAQTRAIAERASPSEQSGGIGVVSDRVGRGAAELVDLKSEIDQKKVELADLREEILTAINSVPDVKQRKILRHYYINLKSLRQIAKKMGMRKSTVYDCLQLAHENFSKINQKTLDSDT